MAITFTSYNIDFKISNKNKLKNWIKTIIEKNQDRLGSINYIFCNDDYILEINNQYLKHNYYTDIITFDYSSNRKLEGDIFISIDTVKSNSLKFKTTFEQELLRVIIHGVLHLSGLKDKTKKEQDLMRKAEDDALQLFCL